MDSWATTLFWFALLFLTSMLLFEISPQSVQEGFTGLIPLGNSQWWARLVPRRGDVGPEREENGFFRDNRYFNGYVDIQRFGQDTDYCRIVMKKGGKEEDKFLACALGGTENLSSTSFRSPTVKEGFTLSRDDYMRDVDGDGRADYCRILKKPDGAFQAECSPTTDTGVILKRVIDSKPPAAIETLLSFYKGCVFWLRLRDDMVDYAQNLYVNVSGGATVDESEPNPDKTEGLRLNGVNQFLRIGDDPYLNLGTTIPMRSLRAFHFWVKFDDFTNNAHIFDFGNGAGIDNTWVGILNRGNLGLDETEKKPLLCGGETTVPDPPSGAQAVEVTTPQNLMKTTSANVEEFTCEGFAVAPRLLPKLTRQERLNPATSGPAKTADMCYEIWDRDQRKMRIVVPMMFELEKWTHVVITAVGTDSFRPDIAIYKNGKQVWLEQSGWLPQQSETQKNYIGKSNWADATSQYANKDELLKGAVFDVRGYVEGLSEKVVRDSYTWGKGLLGISDT